MKAKLFDDMISGFAAAKKIRLLLSRKTGKPVKCAVCGKEIKMELGILSNGTGSYHVDCKPPIQK